MTCLSVVPKDLGEETIKSNSCGDVNFSDVHSVENLLMGSALCMGPVSWPGCAGTQADCRQRGREQRDTPSPVQTHLDDTENSWACVECQDCEGDPAP